MGFTFERTTDWECIKSTITHPRVYGIVTDDFAPRAEDYEPPRDSELWYVKASRGPAFLGLWILKPGDGGAWDVHLCYLPASYGIAAVSGRAFVHWLWENTPCERLIAAIPAFNRLAIAMAKSISMSEYSRASGVYMKHGQLHDVIYLGLNKSRVG